MQRLEVPVPRPRRDGVVRSLVVDVAIPRLLLVSRAIVVPELIRPSHGGAWLIPSPRRRSPSTPFAVLLLFVLVRELVLLLVVLLQGIVLDHRHRPGLGEKLGSDRDDRVVAVLVLVVVVALLLLRLGLLERDVGELEDGAAFFFGAGTLGERGFGRCGSLQRGDGLDHGHAWRDGGRRGDGGNHRRGLRHPEPHRGGRRDGGNDDGRRWGVVVAPATQRIIVILLIVVVVVHAPAHRHRRRSSLLRIGCHHRRWIYGCHDGYRGSGGRLLLLILVDLIVVVVVLELGEHVGRPVARRQPRPRLLRAGVSVTLNLSKTNKGKCECVGEARFVTGTLCVIPRLSCT